MTRRRLLLGLSIPLILAVLLTLVLTTGWGLSLSLRLVSSLMPGRLTVSVQQGSLLGPIQLRDVHYRDKQINLLIKKLDLDWHALDLLAGQLNVTHLRLRDVDIRLHETASTRTPSTAKFVLPLTLELHQIAIRHLVIQVPGQAAPIEIAHVALTATSQGRTLHIHEFTIAAYRAQAHLAGELQLRPELPMKLTLAMAYQATATQAINTRGVLQGNLQRMQLKQKISGAVTADMDGEVRNLLTQLRWQARLKLDRFRLNNFVATAPPLVVNGGLSLNGDSRQLRAKGQLHVDDKQIGVANIDVTAQADSGLSHYRFTSKGDFVGVTLPPMKLDMTGEGGQQKIQITQLQAQLLNGSAQGKALVAWEPRQNIQVQLAFQNLQTSGIFQQWPATLNGDASLQSDVTQRARPVQFNLRHLRGELRGHPLQGNVSGTWSEHGLALKTAKLHIGGTDLNAHGQLLHHQWDVQFKAHSDELNDLLPMAKGRVALQGRLSGSAATPRLRMQGTATQLVYAQNRVANLRFNMDMGLARNAAAQLDIEARDLSTRHLHWNTVELRSDGTNAAHRISLQARNDNTSLDAQWHGRFVPWRWQGQLDQFQYHQTAYGDWSLQTPVALQLAKDKFRLANLCLLHQSAHLCLHGQWDRQVHQVVLDAKALPLHLLTPWLPKDIQMTGQLDAQAKLAMSPKGAYRAQLSVRSPDKSIALDFVQLKQQLRFGASEVRASLDASGLQASLHIPLVGGGGVDSALRLPNWSPQVGLPHAQAVKATLDIVRLPANVVTRFIPNIGQAKGELFANLKIGGSLGKPHLGGSAKWQAGSLSIPQLGIQVHAVSATLESTRTNTLGFMLKAQSGKGDVTLSGETRLDPRQGWPTQATLLSHDLEVSNLPQAFILVDAKVKLNLQGNTIKLDGDVTVPKARLQPRGFPEGSVPLSPDVVIVRGDGVTPTRWQVSSHLKVKLGDEVSFNGFGIRGKLRGNLILNDEPGKLVMGQGQISIVDGIYRLRGQDLTIRHGRLIFSNTFIDDPGLDVEAVRTINTVTAGVRLKGTLKQPQLTIFSEPTMSESDALAYLLLGHPLNQTTTTTQGQTATNAASALGFVAGDILAKGIGGTLGLDELRVAVDQTTQNTSLVMGKYLSPKLYLRYYSGIAESSRILQLQYQLSPRVQIQTESGYRGTQSITGGDIFFTIDY